MDFSKISPPRHPDSPQAVVRSREFLDFLAEKMPLALLSRGVGQKQIFEDIKVGRFKEGASTGTGLLGTYRSKGVDPKSDALLNSILNQRGVDDQFKTNPLSFMFRGGIPERGSPDTFGTTGHEMGHEAFDQSNLYDEVFASRDARDTLPNGYIIDEEDIMRLLDLESGIRNKETMGHFKRMKGMEKISIPELMSSPGVLKILARVHEAINKRINIPPLVRYDTSEGY